MNSEYKIDNTAINKVTSTNYIALELLSLALKYKQDGEGSFSRSQFYSETQFAG